MSTRYCPRCEGKLSHPTNTIGYCPRCHWKGGPNKFLTEFKPVNKSKDARWMPYVSIDLETTGLDPEHCQILEVGAVIDNWHDPIEKLPHFHRYITPQDTIKGQDYLYGQPYALALNAKIIKHLATAKDDPEICEEGALGPTLAVWLMENGIDPLHVTASGKNFASFDLQFLRRLPGFSQFVNFKHRSIDPAVFYWWPDVDDCLPATKDCLERAGFDSYVAHTAVEDCIGVIRLVRRGVRKCCLTPT